MSERNDMIAACLGLMDRNPPKQPVIGLTFAERQRLRAQGLIKPRPAPVPNFSERLNRMGRRHPNYGKAAAVAREYNSKPRFHGDMKRMAEAAGISLTGLSDAVRREQLKNMRRAAA